MLLTSALWGSSFLMMKYALVDLNPFQISFYRIFFGMILSFKRVSNIILSRDINPFKD